MKKAAKQKHPLQSAVNKMWDKSKKQAAKRKQRDQSEESDLSFISKGDEDLYDPLNPNINFGKRRYRYKSSSDEDVQEANYDEIEEEEFISGVIGDQEDEEQLRILEQEERRKRQRLR